MNINGIWEGAYTYGSDYPENIAGTSIKFTVELLANGSDISGSFTDQETRDIFPEGGTLDGAHENNYINMIKRYSCTWGFNEDGEMIIMKDQPSHLIVYEGYIENGMFTGSWEIPVFNEEKLDQPGLIYQEITGSGTWWMQKK